MDEIPYHIRVFMSRNLWESIYGDDQSIWITPHFHKHKGSSMFFTHKEKISSLAAAGFPPYNTPAIKGSGAERKGEGH
jgi:hypothetical protein